MVDEPGLVFFDGPLPGSTPRHVTLLWGRHDQLRREVHAESLAALVALPDLPQGTTARRAPARFVIDAYALAREAAHPQSAVDDVFRVIDAAWTAASGSQAPA